MRNYCTLFDNNYAAKGLALHSSLLKYSSEPWTLDILCLDRDTYALLQELELPNVQLWALDNFETAMNMRPVKSSRSMVEYYWTCASSFLEFLMSRTQYEECAYLDADLFFFSDPKVVFDEIGTRSIAIVPHRFARENRHLERNGRFNVGWISFKRTQAGLKCLGQWAAATRHWCYHRNENGKFGDQGYLNSFEAEYGSEVAVLQNIGIGVAPWNISQWKVTGGPCVDGVQTVFYHMHEYRSASQLTNYLLRPEDREFIYQPYNAAIRNAESAIASAEASIAERQKAMREIPVG